MSERFNIYFYDDGAGAPYCLLALRARLIKDDQPALKPLLMLLTNIVEGFQRSDDSSLGQLAAKVVGDLAAEAKEAVLLPGGASPEADLTVNIQRLQQEEFWLSCRTIKPDHFPSLSQGRNPLDAIDGFEGNVEQLREIIDLVEWEQQQLPGEI
jgi:hypothetical protein